MSRVNIASLNINLIANSRGLKTETEKAISIIKGFGSQANDAGAQFGGLRNQVLGFGAALGAIRGLDALKDITIGFVVDSVGLAAELETGRTQFETILGDSDAAAKLVKSIQSFANETPFSSEELVNAGKQLLSYGQDAESIIPTVATLGDIAAGSGANLADLAEIYGRAAAEGRIQQEGLNRLTDRAIPVYKELEKQLGKNTAEIRELASEGKISFRDLQQAFVGLTTEGGVFESATVKLSNTVSGKLSTLGDAVDELSRNFGTNLAPATKEAIELLIETAGAAKEISSALAGINDAGIIGLVESIKAMRIELALGTLGVKELLSQFGLIEPLDIQVEVQKTLEKITEVTGGKPKDEPERVGIESLIGSEAEQEISKAKEEMKALEDSAKQAADSIREKFKDPLDAFRDTVAQINQAVTLGGLENSTAIKAINAEMQKMVENARAARDSAGGELGARVATDNPAFQRGSVEAENELLRIRSGDAQPDATEDPQLLKLIESLQKIVDTQEKTPIEGSKPSDESQKIITAFEKSAALDRPKLERMAAALDKLASTGLKVNVKEFSAVS